jgi:ATP-dependent helicase/nuclease subunit B
VAAPAYTWLEEAIAADALVLCASRRLARELRTAYDQQQVDAGRRSWRTPPVLFWQDWLADAWESAAASKLAPVLEPASATLLWEECLGRTSREQLLSDAAVVRHAEAAWQRIHDWRLSLADVAAAASSRDEHWFVRAATAYSQRLQQGGWIDQAQLCGSCTSELGTAELVPGSRVVHAGFDRLTPVLQFLFETLAEQGVTVTAAPRVSKPISQLCKSFKDNNAQWRAAGTWARHLLEREPGARLAVIAPDLESNADAITHNIREGFAPGWQLAGERYRRSVNVSYGRRLVDFPAIAVAHNALRLAASGLRSSDVSLVLRSPFFGDPDRGASSRLEQRLRGLPDRAWNPEALLAAVSTPRLAADSAQWRQKLEHLQQLRADGEARLPPARWAERFDQLLQAIGWPGIEKADSDEFQLLNRWRQLLNELAALDRVKPAMTLAETVRHLGQLAADTLYQPEAPAGGLSVIGLLEATGMEFDCLWIGGMDASRWPTAGHPLALLNRELQRGAGMPDATPVDTLEFARRTLDRLCRSASDVVLSWARSDGDTEQVASPLLDVEDESDVAADSADPGWYARAWTGSAACAPLQTDPAPRVAVGEALFGGAYTVQLMREEPFAAFVAGRLGVSALERFQPGISARQRGIVLHDALHRLLASKPTQSELAAWDTQTRATRVEESAWRAISEISRHADDVLRQVLHLEKQRLQKVLQDFLDHELQRDEFRIDALEQKLELELGNVCLNLRIDRIDRLPDDCLLIADYKSGTRKPFMNRKLNAPAHIQLSVYAKALEGHVGGLALINIDSREISYQGEGGSISFGRIKPDDWPDALRRWCAEVEALLVRFGEGDIGVNQAQSADQARPLALLSRLEELRRDR